MYKKLKSYNIIIVSVLLFLSLSNCNQKGLGDPLQMKQKQIGKNSVAFLEYLIEVETNKLEHNQNIIGSFDWGHKTCLKSPNYTKYLDNIDRIKNLKNLLPKFKKNEGWCTAYVAFNCIKNSNKNKSEIFIREIGEGQNIIENFNSSKDTISPLEIEKGYKFVSNLNDFQNKTECNRDYIINFLGYTKIYEDKNEIHNKQSTKNKLNKIFNFKGEFFLDIGIGIERDGHAIMIRKDSNNKIWYFDCNNTENEILINSTDQLVDEIWKSSAPSRFRRSNSLDNVEENLRTLEFCLFCDPYYKQNYPSDLVGKLNISKDEILSSLNEIDFSTKNWENAILESQVSKLIKLCKESDIIDIIESPTLKFYIKSYVLEKSYLDKELSENSYEKLCNKFIKSLQNKDKLNIHIIRHLASILEKLSLAELLNSYGNGNQSEITYFTDKARCISSTLNINDILRLLMLYQINEKKALEFLHTCKFDYVNLDIFRQLLEKKKKTSNYKKILLEIISVNFKKIKELKNKNKPNVEINKCFNTIGNILEMPELSDIIFDDTEVLNRLFDENYLNLINVNKKDDLYYSALNIFSKFINKCSQGTLDNFKFGENFSLFLYNELGQDSQNQGNIEMITNDLKLLNKYLTIKMIFIISIKNHYMDPDILEKLLLKSGETTCPFGIEYKIKAYLSKNKIELAKRLLKVCYRKFNFIPNDKMIKFWDNNPELTKYINSLR